MNAPTTLAISRLTGRPVAASSAVAMAVPVEAAKPKLEIVPTELQQIIRPNASTRWILPQLASITPTYIEGVLRGAFTGSHIQAWELFDLMEDTWPRLSKNLNELKRAVVQMDWQLEPWAEEDEPPTDAARERAKLVSSALWRMQPDPCADENGFQQTIYDVLDAWGKGLSVLEILWHIRRAGQLGDITAPRATVWVRPNNYAWSQEGRLGLNPNALDTGGRGSRRAYLSTPSYFAQPTDLIEFPDDKFLIAIAKAKTGPAMVGALLRPLAWWWCAANFSADWVMNLAQVFGLPFRWANYSTGASESTVSAISAMLENMGSAGWAAFPEGTTLELKEASKTGDNSPQGDLLDRADKNCDLLILGQTLTSDTGGSGAGGGSLALGKVHAGVKEENVRAAATFAAEVINRQLIPAILRLNYGDEEEAPEFCPESGAAENIVEQMNAIGTAVRAGIITPSRDDEKNIRVSLNLPPMSKDVEREWKKQGGARSPITLQDETTNPLAFKAARKRVQENINTDGSRSWDVIEMSHDEAALEATANTRPAPPSGVQVNRLAVAFAEDLQPLRERLERILTIEDPEVLRAKLVAFRDSLPALLKDINADPESARALEDAMASGILRLIKR